MYDRVIVVGAVRWYPDFILTSPRSLDTLVVCHAWIGDQAPDASTFGEDASRAERLAPEVLASQRPHGFLPALPPDEIVPRVDVDAMAHRARAEDAAEGDLEVARFVELEGGWGVFLAADTESTVFTIEFDGEEPYVAQVSVTEIREGMFLVLRTKGSGDYVRSVADSLLADSESLRAAQSEWKRPLRRAVQATGAKKLAKHLREAYGFERIYWQKLEYWASERNIAPGEKASLGRILEYVGLQQKLDAVWEAARILRGAHQQAGGVIRDQLIEAVRHSTRASLEAAGTMEFTLPAKGAGRLTAFRIVRVTEETREIPSGQIGRPIEVAA